MDLRVLLSLEPKVNKAAASAAKQEVSGLVRAGDLAGGVARGAAGGAGLGFIGQLIGAGGIIGAATAVGAILKRSVDLAIQFDRVAMSTTATLNLGGANLVRNYEAFRRQALTAGISMGYGPAQMEAGMSVYGLVSGRNLAAVRSNAPGLATMARALGYQDVTQFAQIMGQLAPYSGGDVTKDAGLIGGAAMTSGDAGRRISEFIGVATNTLIQLQTQNPAATLTDALKAMTLVTGSPDKFFRTPQGEQIGVAAVTGLVTGNQGDMGRAALAARAGVSPLDVILGRAGHNDENIVKMLNEIRREYGQNPKWLASALVAMYGQQQGAALFSLMTSRKGPFTTTDIKSATGALTTQAKELMGTPAGELAKTMADLEKAETNLGEGVLIKQVLPAMHALRDVLDKGVGGLTKAFGELSLTEKILIGALVANSLAQAGGSVGKLIGWLRGLGGAAAAAGGAAEAGGAAGGGAAAGAGILPALLGIGGGVGLIGLAGWATKNTPGTGGVADAMSAARNAESLAGANPTLTHEELMAIGGGVALPGMLGKVPRALLERVAKEQGISPFLLASVMMHESGGNPLAKGYNKDKTGRVTSIDLGLMQVNDYYHRGFRQSGGGELWKDPYSNLSYGAHYLRQKIDAAGGDIYKALAWYNGDAVGGAYDRAIQASMDDLIQQSTGTAVTHVPTANGTLVVQSTARFVPNGPDRRTAPKRRIPAGHK